MKRLLPLIAALWLAAPLSAQPVIEDQNTLDELVDSYVDDGMLPLLYVRVEDRDGNVVYERGTTNADLLPNQTVNGDSWLRIWSMSKIVTITAALDMVEDGILKFDDPVSTFIPEFAELEVAVYPPFASTATTEEELEAELAEQPACPEQRVKAERDITVRDLLNHTAGFYYGVSHVECLNKLVGAQALAQATSSDDLIARMAKLPLIQQPGDAYYYGTNTTVLGLVMERAAGQSLKTIVADRVTGPLGIEKLRYGLPQGSKFFPRHTGNGGKLRIADAAELDIFASPPPGYDPSSELYLGGEGMVATTAAYMDFLHLLLGRGEANGVRILDEMTIEALSSPHTQLDSKWGHNGWNLWVNSGLLANGEQGRGGLWIGGGYEGTAFWVDHANGLIGQINTQVHNAPEGAGSAVETIREAIYARLSTDENAEE
ncbi:MAG: serine hydrolase [Pseudomonadota bacterium]